MTTALVIIDVQKNILAIPGARPAVLERFDEVRGWIAHLVDEARRADILVIFVQHDGAPGHRLQAGSPGWEICEDLNRSPADTVVRKTACDSFHETNLQAALAARDIRHLVIAGLMTQYCVDTTCRRAVGLGYDVTLVADGHTTSDSALLSVEQIVAHHNAVLDGFNVESAVLTVTPASDVKFKNGGEAT
ncbi:cysteine hydrolase family protein [Microvirga sp. 2MCAF38]|uniref:cysteine hydrolase family protein n=1 Tax=Microvirga sp. 2MCAF38 TaxID=3232989 RepID=UPI003F95248A